MFTEPPKVDAQPATAEAPPPPPPKKRAPPVKRSITLAGILADLDETFANLKRASALAQSQVLYGLSEGERRGLKTLGPLVVSRDSWTALTDIHGEPADIPRDNASIPSHIMVAINEGDKADADYMAPDFAFAIKIRKPPWSVARQQGQCWMFGMAWRKRSGELIWAHCYAYTFCGKVHPAHWLADKPVSVPGGSYTQRTWSVAAWNETGGRGVAATMAATISLYMRRREHWNVATRKGSQRAIFLIDKKDTAYAFKDREATALASDGKRKRIIHFVREHTQARANGKVVTIPAHIRGLREFDWSGYQCFVTAPEHHVFSGTGFTLASEEFSAEEDTPPGMMTFPQLAAELVAHEDELNSRRKTAA